MDIGGVLSRAWQIVWKYKVLWIFGILASCGGAGGSQESLRYEYQLSRSELPLRAQAYFHQLARIPSWEAILIVSLLVLAVLLLVALLLFLGTMGRIGLIRGTQQAESGAEHLPFGELFRGGLPYFWRVFLLDLLVGILVALVIGATVAFFVFGAIVTRGILMICLFPLICLLAIAFILIAWLINVVIEQANNAIVIENLGIVVGLQRGWEVVKAHFGMMIVMGLILILGVQGIIGFILGLPLFLIVIPAFMGAMARTTQALWTGLLVAGLCMIAYLPVFIFLNGILRAYIGTAWALTFMHLTGKPTAVPELLPEITT
jgi:hypothetical protein